jgi:hypothetical protein
MDYLKIARTHRLPKGLEQFEVQDCKSLPEIRRKVMEHFEAYAKYLEELIQPEAYAPLTECKLLDENDKRRIFSTHRRLMFLLRRGMEIGLSSQPADESQFLVHALAEWQHLREDLKHIIAKGKAAWTEEQELSENPGYFG